MNTKQTHTGAALPSHNLLAAIDASFDREDIEERWKPHGYSIDAACRASTAYEEWAGELLSFQDVDDAIGGSNITGGLFPERLEAFFKGWILSANAEVSHGDRQRQPDTHSTHKQP